MPAAAGPRADRPLQVAEYQPAGVGPCARIATSRPCRSTTTSRIELCTGIPYRNPMAPVVGFGTTRPRTKLVGLALTLNTTGLNVTLIVWFAITFVKV